jgi:hypothetical protein
MSILLYFLGVSWAQSLDEKIKALLQKREDPEVYTGKVLAEKVLLKTTFLFVSHSAS